eukprot:88558-Pleurochrysis_carterae.AAC.2
MPNARARSCSVSRQRRKPRTRSLPIHEVTASQSRSALRSSDAALSAHARIARERTRATRARHSAASKRAHSRTRAAARRHARSEKRVACSSALSPSAIATAVAAASRRHVRSRVRARRSTRLSSLHIEAGARYRSARARRAHKRISEMRWRRDDTTYSSSASFHAA